MRSAALNRESSRRGPNGLRCRRHVCFQGGRWLALLPALALSACIVVPRTTESYDADCRVVAKHMELTTVQVAGIQHCSNNGCATALAVIGATAAASAVISGSIVLVGNVVYWFEKQGRCQRSG